MFTTPEHHQHQNQNYTTTNTNTKHKTTIPPTTNSNTTHNYKQNPTNRIQNPQTPTKLQNHHRSTNKTHGLAGGEGDLSEASQVESRWGKSRQIWARRIKVDLSEARELGRGRSKTEIR